MRSAVTACGCSDWLAASSHMVTASDDVRSASERHSFSRRRRRRFTFLQTFDVVPSSSRGSLCSTFASRQLRGLRPTAARYVYIHVYIRLTGYSSWESGFGYIVGMRLSWNFVNVYTKLVSVYQTFTRIWRTIIKR